MEIVSKYKWVAIQCPTRGQHVGVLKKFLRRKILATPYNTDTKWTRATRGAFSVLGPQPKRGWKHEEHGQTHRLKLGVLINPSNLKINLNYLHNWIEHDERMKFHT